MSFADTRYIGIFTSCDSERVETNIYLKVDYASIAQTWSRSELEGMTAIDRSSPIAVTKSLVAALIKDKYDWFQDLVGPDFPKIYEHLQDDPTNAIQSVDLVYGLSSGQHTIFRLTRHLADGSAVPGINITEMDSSGTLHSPLEKLMNPFFLVFAGILVDRPSGVSDLPTQLNGDFSGFTITPLLDPNSTTQDTQVWMSLETPNWGAVVTDENANYVLAADPPPQGPHLPAVVLFRASVEALLAIPDQDDFQASAEYSAYLSYFGDKSRTSIVRKLGSLTGNQLASYKQNFADMTLTRIIGGTKCIYICYRTANQHDLLYATVLLGDDASSSRIVNINSGDLGLKHILELPVIRSELWP